MSRRFRVTAICFAAAFTGATTASAQIAAGGSFTINQSVIASGGGQNAAGGNFTLDGTIGEAIAGTRSTNPPFDVASGFLAAPQLSPTAANVIIGGRVTTSDGRGIRNARVMLTGISGESRTVLTGTFGYYRFTDIAAGRTYIISAAARRFTFGQPAQVVNAAENLDSLNFTANP